MRRLKSVSLKWQSSACSKASTPVTRETGGALDVFIDTWEGRKGGRRVIESPRCQRTVPACWHYCSWLSQCHLYSYYSNSILQISKQGLGSFSRDAEGAETGFERRSSVPPVFPLSSFGLVWGPMLPPETPSNISLKFNLLEAPVASQLGRTQGKAN